MKTSLNMLFSRLKRIPLSQASTGSVAIEAALLIPLAVFIVIGGMELYHYFRVVSIVDRTAFSIANSLSMQREIDDYQLCRQTNDICTYQHIAQDLMTPLNYRHYGGIAISLYTTDGNSNDSVVWHPQPKQRIYRGENNTSPIASTLTPPAHFPQPSVNDSIIVVEVFYRYTPFTLGSTFWRALGGERQLVGHAFYRPRFSNFPSHEG